MKRIWFAFLLGSLCVCLLTGCRLFSWQKPEQGSQLTLAEEQVPDAPTYTWQVSVMLQDAPGLTVKSENPICIGAGGEASFAVEIADDYLIENLSAGAVYEDGVITLPQVWFPTTVEVTSRLKRPITLAVSNNVMDGQVTSTAGEEVMEGDCVTLSVTPKAGCVFLGYSLEKDYNKGGELLCASPEYTFTVTQDVKIVTNYYYVGNGRLIMYDGNGADQKVTYDVFPNKSAYICPHTLANKGQFTRDGYVLYGYNTSPDGSGTYYGTGWNVPMPEEGTLTLYAQWLAETPASDFSYRVQKKQVIITKYNGNDERVVIPETIEGYPVTTIQSGTFSGKKLDTLYISRNVTNVEKSAVKGCPRFTTLYLCDNVVTISDSSFESCPQFSKLYMLACMAPRYMTSRNGTYQIKYQRLITAESPKLVITSGSNSAYGIDSALLEEQIGHRYNVVNYGCNASTPANFYIEVISHFMNEQDILLHEPESNKYQWGYNEMNTTTWQIFEGAFDAYAQVDIRHYIRMFDSFSQFNNSRMSMTARTYEMFSSETVNKYGDFIKKKVGTNSSTQTTVNGFLAAGGEGTYTLDEKLLSNANMKNLNQALDMVADTGAKVYISFGAVMDICLKKTERTPTAYKVYRDAVIKYAHGTVISVPETYVMPYKYFYNSVYHLNTEGSQVRTRNLAKDLMAQFAKE